MNILEKIVESTKARVERGKKEGLPQPAPKKLPPFSFERALEKQGLSFICEAKKASPSKGVICEGFHCADIAIEYESAGADAISVLTEPDFFLGSIQCLSEARGAVGAPLLRKDFIIDPFQIEESAAVGADAILLICAILSPKELKAHIKAADNYGMSCLVEAHSEEEARLALSAGARVVGANNRNLKTFGVDFSISARIRNAVPKGVLFVAESGVKSPEDISALREIGADAVLVGETLMRAKDKGAALAALRGEICQR